MIGQDQSNLLLSNQARTLDGAIFPWLRDTRAFLLLNHLAYFKCIFTLTGSCNFVSLRKIYSCLFIPNCTRNHVITYTNLRRIGLFTDAANYRVRNLPCMKEMITMLFSNSLFEKIFCVKRPVIIYVEGGWQKKCWACQIFYVAPPLGYANSKWPRLIYQLFQPWPPSPTTWQLLATCL